MAGTAADRGAEQTRVNSIENNDQRGAHGAKQVKRGPAYGTGLKQYGKGQKNINGTNIK